MQIRAARIHAVTSQQTARGRGPWRRPFWFITTMRPGARWSANQLVNTPPKRPSSQGGAIARGSFACSGYWPNIHYTRIAARPIPPPFTFYGTRAIRCAKHAGIACGAEPAAARPASASLCKCARRKSTRSPVSKQHVGVGRDVDPSDSLPQFGRELVDPLVNTPPKRTTLQGGAMSRG